MILKKHVTLSLSESCNTIVDRHVFPQRVCMLILKSLAVLLYNKEDIPFLSRELKRSDYAPE